MGYEVQSEAFELVRPNDAPIPVRNLYVEAPAAGDDDRWLVIGAHFDTVEGTPGADDNASGVAGVLALASYFRMNPQPIGLRFELYTNEELLIRGQNQMGSLRRARAAQAAGDEIVGAIILEMIGYYTGEPVTPMAERFAAQLGVSLPDNDLFLAIASWESARGLAERIADEWSGPIAVLPVLTPVGEPMAVRSDHRSYLRVGVPAVMLTDTAEFRNPHYHGPADTPDSLNFTHMAAAVDSVRGVIEAISADPEIRKESHSVAQAAQESERVECRNAGKTPVVIMMSATGESRTLAPGESDVATVPLGSAVKLAGIGSLRLGRDTLVFSADRVAPPVRVRVQGQTVTRSFTRGGSAYIDRDGPIVLEIDRVEIRITRPEPSRSR